MTCGRDDRASAELLPQMPRRVVLPLLAALLVAAPALAGDIHKQKARIDAKISTLQGKITAAQQRESSLRGQIANVTAQIRTLEGQVVDVSAKLDVLQHDLALHQARLDKLNALYDLQTRKYEFERRQYHAALGRLNARLVDIYTSTDPSTLDVILASRSFEATMDQIDYLNAIAGQDKQIAADVAVAKRQARTAQLHTRVARKRVTSEVQVVAVRTYQVGEIKAKLLGAHAKLTTTRKGRRSRLVDVQETKQEYLSEEQGLLEASASLTAKIQAAQSGRTGVDSTPSSAGLIWPVSGPVTSPFGMRWGRMHEGIDIGVPDGTPIHAAASGSVIYAGWESGYGNLVVLDDGGNLATAYAHQSRIAVSIGQQVAQGDVIGYSGCTGHCLGPHLHFEVRVGGTPVDPLGYL
jgi:murein DD-endopeptidase MepM/ murein hydrolase activator NlpD